MHERSTVEKRFISLLELISQKAGNSFSGIGLLLYNQKTFTNTHYSDLRPSYKCPKLSILDGVRIIDYLLDITDESNYLQDGFIFFNETGDLTHVSQYFAPMPRGNIIPNEKYGTRYRTAQYGSFLEGIILIGTINHDKQYYIFENGVCIK